MQTPHSAPGHVYFVGAGPGDPGLITVKGAQYLEEADVVLYDALLDERLLALTPAACENIHVGKRGGHKSYAQEDINNLLVQHARAARRVVRLKGGDPFIFGRGGIEAMHLREAGVPFEIVSGVTAAAGVAAYAGIPLTHRDIASSAVLVTGYEDPTKTTPSIDWSRLAPLDSTLVIYMGVSKLAEISNLLLQHGRPADTPTAVVEWGTWPRQRTLVSSLECVAADSQARGIGSPALIIIGRVVDLRPYLDWFESKPLFSKQVLITRSREQAGDLQLLLEAEGAQVGVLPLLQIQPPDDPGALDASIGRLHQFSWIIFTSPNGVDFFFQRLHHLGKDSRAFGGARIAAGGLATAEHLQAQGLHPDLVPQNQSQDGLVEAFSSISLKDKSVLLPTSALGRDLLPTALTTRGAQVERVIAYENRPPEPGSVDLPPALQNNALDLVIFASPSSVHNFAALLGAEQTHTILSSTAIACIGPTTAQAVADLNLEVQIQPQESSIATLVQAICTHYQEKPHE
jgi:uroporphyrinogen III methyltransferase/synthase